MRQTPQPLYVLAIACIAALELLLASSKSAFASNLIVDDIGFQTSAEQYVSPTYGSVVGYYWTRDVDNGNHAYSSTATPSSSYGVGVNGGDAAASIQATGNTITASTSANSYFFPDIYATQGQGEAFAVFSVSEDVHFTLTATSANSAVNSVWSTGFVGLLRYQSNGFDELRIIQNDLVGGEVTYSGILQAGARYNFGYGSRAVTFGDGAESSSGSATLTLTSLSSVPEPSSLALLGLGGLGLIVGACRRRLVA